MLFIWNLHRSGHPGFLLAALPPHPDSCVSHHRLIPQGQESRRGACSWGMRCSGWWPYHLFSSQTRQTTVCTFLAPSHVCMGLFFFFCMDFDVLSSQRFRQEVRINPHAQDTKSASNDTTFSLANHRVKDASEFLTPRPLYRQFISLSFISRVPPPVMG